MKALPRYLAAAALLALSACAPATTPPQLGAEEGPQIGSQELRIEVENQNFHDATIYAVGNGYRDRLGYVTGKTTEFFTFKWHTFDVRMLIDFVGAGSLLSDPLPVQPGIDDNLYLIIQSGDHNRAR